jgi:cytochrome oxidase Cu insertion factor (SCO1/SenC/PrrC family)
MSSGLDATNPTLEAAFRSALLNQGTVAFLTFVLLAITWVGCREALLAKARPRLVAHLAARRASQLPEPAARRILRIGFGALWILDGLLQAQPAMPGGLPSQVIGPSAAGSPRWALDLVNWAGTSWSYHPVQAAAAAVWIQLGIGIWLVASSSPRWSRLAGLVSAGWGLIVWVFGEAFGSMLAPGQSWLMGAPGAALFCCAAGVLLAVPLRCYRTDRLGRVVLQLAGLMLIAFALLQAWPGRGFWQGSSAGRPGSLTSGIAAMAATRQPSLLHRLLTWFGAVVTSHGFAVNVIVVVALAGIGACLVTGRLAIIRPAVVVAIVFCLADWVLVQDLGFLGGLGTDPNSMLPQALLLTAGLVALARPQASQVRAPALAPEALVRPSNAARLGAAGWLRRPGRVARGAGVAFGTASASAVLALWAVAMVLLGAAPMAGATADRTADPIIATALNGPATRLTGRAPGFTLTDQDGRTVSLAGLRGKVVLLTFLDPVCTTDCPLIAQEFRAADQALGRQAGRVELVAIVANPRYRSVADTRAFDQAELLSGVPNWLFLTGSLAQLQAAWREYYVTAQAQGPGAMILHPDVAYVISASGREQAELNMDPGPGDASSRSSFAAELAQAAGQSIRSPQASR